MAIGGIWGVGTESEKKLTVTFQVMPENATVVLRDVEQQIIDPIQDKTYKIVPRYILL